MSKKKIALIAAATVFVLMTAFLAAALFLFSPKGNAVLKNYAEKELNKKMEIPVEIRTFQMVSGIMVVEIEMADGSRLSFDGSYSIAGLKVKGRYHADIADMSVLQPFTGRELRGPLRVSGDLTWQKGKWTFEGLSDIFGSRSRFSGRFDDPVLADFVCKIEHLKIEALFEGLGLPVYATGTVDATADISAHNFSRKRTDGRLDVLAENITSVDAVMKETLRRDHVIPVQAAVEGEVVFEDTVALFMLSVRSNLFSFRTDGASYHLTSGRLHTGYEVVIPELKKLAFITDRDMTGAFQAGGSLKREGKKGSFSATTASFGGTIAVSSQNNRLRAEMRQVCPETVSRKFGAGQMFAGDGFCLDAEVVLYGETMEEVLNNLYGDVHLRANNIVLNTIDIDGAIAGFSRTREINLFDITAIALAGPFGLVFSKGQDISRSVYGSRTGSSIVNEINAQWEINRGIAETRDVALSTPKNRLATRGRIRLRDQRFLSFNIALVDEKGCPVFMQQVDGRVTRPRVSASRAVAETARTVLNALFSRVPSGKDPQPDTDCEVFYDGVVQHPSG